MTGIDFCVDKPHMSRSYLNHLVYSETTFTHYVYKNTLPEPLTIPNPNKNNYHDNKYLWGIILKVVDSKFCTLFFILYVKGNAEIC